MQEPVASDRPSRGHKKRARTRAGLIAAGLRVLARKGEALTASDVVAEAQVSNGTFYNYFTDRDQLVDALAAELALTLAAESRVETVDGDPALGFAVATARVLARAGSDPTWGRVVLRLSDQHADVLDDVLRYLRDDLVAGVEQGRFDVGPDDATLDLVTGLLLMGIRRIVRGEADAGYPLRVLERGLRALGVPSHEVPELARAAATAAGSTEGDE